MPERLTFCDPERLEGEYLTEFLAEKRVPQNLFYLLNGANSFYSYRSIDLEQIGPRDEYRFFRAQPFWSPDCRVAFVSLGCGNAGAEKALLEQMHAEGCRVHYVGVDSSESMLELAAANLADSGFAQTFAMADFGLPDFPAQLQDVVKDADVRVYAMMGGTFGNFEQAMIADLLARLVPSEDYLYLDVVPMYAADDDNQRLRARLSRLPENMRLFFDRLLSVLGLAREDGALYGVESSDGEVNTFHYTFYFRPHREITIMCLGEEAVLTPEDQIELMSIRAYDVASLTTFLNRRGFATVGTYVPDVGNLSHLWQRLLFSKSG